MSKPSAQKLETTKSAKAGEFKTKVLAKSDWPKTAKDTVKLIVTTFLNFFT